MSIAYHDRFGRAGGPTVQQIRESAFVSVSGIGHPADITALGVNVLADASSVTGSADSYYMIWGIIASTSKDNTNPFMGNLYDTGISHTPGSIDSACINTFSCCKEGPYFYSADHPVHVTRGAGVKLDASGANSTNILYIYYTLIN